MSKKEPSRLGKSARLVAVGILPILIMALGLLGLNLWGFFENSPAPVVLPPLSSKISPEVMATRRAEEEAWFHSYGWLDKDAGLVRIPIDRAMSLIAERGLPVGEPTATPTPTATATPTSTATPSPTRPSEAPSLGTEVPTLEPTPTPLPTDTPAPTVNLAQVSFTQDVLPIFAQHCTECHGVERTEEGLILLSYAELMAGSFNGSVIEPGDMANSYLIEQITSGRMPKRRDPLTDIEIQIISAWVEQGAPDN
jgi:hypothetical protein